MNLVIGSGVLICLSWVYMVYLIQVYVVFWPGGLIGIDRTLIAKAPTPELSRCNLLSTDRTNVGMRAKL